jgi:2-dehydro-3-deoxy-D-arabinonate dehydratase
MRTAQYRDVAGHRHLLVMNGSGEGVDVSDAVGGDGDLTAAIRKARSEGMPLPRYLDAISRSGSVRLSVDFQAGRARGGAGEFALEAPVHAPEVWAAGVSYLRSREAREAESGAGNIIYTRVYDAERPELFMKDTGNRRTVGPGAAICIRPDSAWSVPEPELALVLDRTGAIVGYTIGNDVSSRDIEAENPLYLPQAKTYAASCALGPAVLIADDNTVARFSIALRILGQSGQVLFEGSTSTDMMRRSFDELIEYLTLFNPVDDGTVLLTGTGIVPHDDFRLEEGHVVEIEIADIGVLRNPVEMAPRLARMRGAQAASP